MWGSGKETVVWDSVGNIIGVHSPTLPQALRILRFEGCALRGLQQLQ